MSGILIAVGFLTYPVLAGLVYRRMGPHHECFERRDRGPFARLECEGRVTSSLMGREFVCSACHERHWSAIKAWLFPLWPLYGIPARLFRIGSNVTAIPAAETEREEATR